MARGCGSHSPPPDLDSMQSALAIDGSRSQGEVCSGSVERAVLCECQGALFSFHREAAVITHGPFCSHFM